MIDLAGGAGGTGGGLLYIDLYTRARECLDMQERATYATCATLSYFKLADFD